MTKMFAVRCLIYVMVVALLTPASTLWLQPQKVEAVQSVLDELQIGDLVDEDRLYIDQGYYPTNVSLSGWDIHRLGGEVTNTPGNWYKLVDRHTSFPVTMEKPFQTQTSGIVTAEFRIKPMTLSDGMRWELRGDDEVAVRIVTKEGAFKLESSEGGFTALQTYSSGVEYGMKIVVDLENATTSIYINGMARALDAEFMQNVDSLNRFLAGIGDAETGEMQMSPIKVHKGYAVNERFLSTIPGLLPNGWTAVKQGGTIAVEQIVNTGSVVDIHSLRMDASLATGSMTLSKSFPEQSGKLVFEWKTLIPAHKDGLSLDLKSGSDQIVHLTTSNGQFAYEDAQNQLIPFYAFRENLWYHIKIELDLASDTISIGINGKPHVVNEAIAPVTGALDQVLFSTDAVHKGSMLLDDILLYEKLPEPLDYVPAPVAAVSEQAIGIQSASLWREGQHYGWDRINPYPERKPYLGYFDDGNPEAKDWEIKWMLEHGIAFELYCWFRPNATAGLPFKDPNHMASLHEGFFNAKYSSQSKFAILFENANSRVQNSADFRDHILPYWIEYYFKDSRYMKLDGRPIIAFYSYSALKTVFGGTVAGVKDELDNIRTTLVAEGLGDPIFILQNSNAASDLNSAGDQKAAGFDAIYAYSWGSNAGYPDVQKFNLTVQKQLEVIDVLPVISVGRDDRAWGGPAGHFATVPQFEEVSEWVRDEYMPSLPTDSLGKEIVLFDNWNEFGEGHFIMPTSLGGFGYLDVIRDVFTDSPAVAETLPTAAQLQRINVLYPQDRQRAAAPEVVPPSIGSTFGTRWDFNTDDDAEGWTVIKQIDSVEVQDGLYTAHSNGLDPGLLSEDELGVTAQDHPYLQLRMKNGSDDVSGKVYYITEQDQLWSESKSVSFRLHAQDAGFTNYDIPMWESAGWTGTIKQIRLDPMNIPGTFQIDHFGFLYSPFNEISTYVNGQLAKLRVAPTTMDTHIMVPAQEYLGHLGVVMEWDADTETLIGVKGDKSIVARAGAGTATLNNTPIALDRAPAIVNGQLFIPLSLIREAFGFSIVWDDDSQTVHVYTESLTWTFDQMDGWQGNAFIEQLHVSAGALHGTALGSGGSSGEPSLLSPDSLQIEGAKVNRIRVRLNNQTDSTSASLYFKTTDDTGWSSTKRISFFTIPNDNEYREYVLDTTNAAGWSGTIDQIKIVPVSGESGDFAIDSVVMDMTVPIFVAGDNLITDPGMETGVAAFATSNVLTQFSADEAYSGHQSLKVTKLAPFGHTRHYANIESNKPYAYSARVKLDAAAGAGGVMQLCLAYEVNGVKKERLLFTSDALSASEWTEVKGVFTISEVGSITNPYMFLYTDRPNTVDSYYLDDLQIREMSQLAGPDWVYVTGLTLTESTGTLHVGKTKQLIAEIAPQQAAQKEIAWRSDQPLVATVDRNGMVYAKSPGAAVITALSVDGGFEASYELTVSTPVAVSGITVSPSTVNVPMDNIVTLTASLDPHNATNQKVLWTSDKPNIATVDGSGNVLGKALGSAIITGRTEDGNYTAQAVVTVTVNGTLGSNLISDPGMEGNVQTFGTSKVNWAFTTDEARTGSQSLQVTKTGAFGHTRHYGDIENGTPFYYSAWAKLDAATTAGEMLRLCLSYEVNGVKKEKLLFSSVPLSSTAWTQVQGVYTINEPGVITNTYLFVYTDVPNQADTFYLDDLELREVVPFPS